MNKNRLYTMYIVRVERLSVTCVPTGLTSVNCPFFPKSTHVTASCVADSYLQHVLSVGGLSNKCFLLRDVPADQVVRASAGAELVAITRVAEGPLPVDALKLHEKVS